MPGVIYKKGVQKGVHYQNSKLETLSKNNQSLKKQNQHTRARIQQLEQEKRALGQELTKTKSIISNQHADIVHLKVENSSFQDTIIEQKTFLKTQRDSLTSLYTTNDKLINKNRDLNLLKAQKEELLAKQKRAIETLQPLARRTMTAEKKTAIMEYLLLVTAVIHLLIFTFSWLKSKGYFQRNQTSKPDRVEIEWAE